MKSQIYGLKILLLLTVLSSHTLADSLPNQIVWNQDGAEMALIPAGSFEMGDHLDNMSNALPVHTVTLDGFYMDKTEVTVGQFRQFVEESDHDWVGSWDDVAQYSPTDDHPIISIIRHYSPLPFLADFYKKGRFGSRIELIASKLLVNCQLVASKLSVNCQ